MSTMKKRLQHKRSLANLRRTRELFRLAKPKHKGVMYIYIP